MISNHTKLINCFIGYTRKDKTFPSFLRELKYNIDSIEPKFRNSKNEVVNPDMILSSRKLNHSIILECKSKGINNDNQIKKYKLISKENFMGFVEVETTKLNFDLTLACLQKSLSKIGKSKDLIKDLPLLVHGEGEVFLSKSYGEFSKKELNNLFTSPIPIPMELPTQYYPFGCDDSPAYISLKILQTIIGFVLNQRPEFDADDILKESHPLWSIFSDTHKKQLKGKLQKIMETKDFEGIKEFIKSKRKGKYYTVTVKSIQERCMRIHKELEEKAKQTILETA